MSKQLAKSQTDNRSSHPTKWWQWVFLYPVLLTSIVAAIPTYIEAFKATKYKVPFGQSSSAEEQDDLWKKNLLCVSAPLDPLVTVHNVKVDATICKSGDVLVQIFDPNGKQFYRWVDVDKVISEANNGLIASAYAATNEDYWRVRNGGAIIICQRKGSTIICQKYLEPGRLLRRISVPGRGCFDEIINTYTGKVLSTTPVACDPNC